jgi:hypothetical protein
MPEFMQGDVDVPGAGKVKKAYLYVPAGLAVAYIAWRWYQAKQDQAAAPASTDGTYTTPDTSEYGASTAGGATSVGGNTGATETDATSSTAIDTNAEWTQKAAELLGNAGYDTATVYSALGEFLARRALDKSEATIARAALAAVGQPPTGGPYSVIEEAGTNTGTLPAPTNVRSWGTHSDTQIGMQWDAVPGAAHYRIYTAGNTEPIGDSLDTKWQGRGLKPNTSYTFYVRAVGTTGKMGGNSSNFVSKTSPVKLSRPTGLKASAVTKSSFRVSCTPVKGATYYRWYVNGHSSGASDRPYRDFTGLKHNTTYSVAVAADTTNQNPGPTSSALRVKTKR